MAFAGSTLSAGINPHSVHRRTPAPFVSNRVSSGALAAGGILSNVVSSPGRLDLKSLCKFPEVRATSAQRRNSIKLQMAGECLNRRNERRRPFAAARFVLLRDSEASSQQIHV